MRLFDSSLRVRHSCPYNDLSVAFPEAEMALWCNRLNEVLRISAPSRSQLGELLRAARRSLGVRSVVRGETSALTITLSCKCDRYRSVTSLADSSGVWLVPPVRYFGGWETHRVFSAGLDSLRRFVSEVRKSGEVEIVSRRSRDRLEVVDSVGLVPVHLFEGLTDHQIRALTAAYESGLLDVPAKARMAGVAQGAGIARSTFGEHLRKAVWQLVRNSYPMLKLYEVDGPARSRARHSSGNAQRRAAVAGVGQRRAGSLREEDEAS